MKILYKKISFTLTFHEKIDFVREMPVPFLFRSIIGKELRRLCCVVHNVLCSTCVFNAACLYGAVFESIVPKDNAALIGRDRVSHPIIIETDPFIDDNLDAISLSLIFLGDTIQHLPYFFQALKKAGEAGILRARVPYIIKSVFDGSRSILVNDETLTPLPPDVWEYHAEDAEIEARKILLITLNSPLRFKVNGHYTDSFSAADFAYSLHRRAQILCAQYGSAADAVDYRHSGAWAISEKNCAWRDLTHYSARQQKAMKLGGVSGNFTLSGTFSGYEQALLRFAELFHAGKKYQLRAGKNWRVGKDLTVIVKNLFTAKSKKSKKEGEK
jgi:hypothetical protein